MKTACAPRVHVSGRHLTSAIHTSIRNAVATLRVADDKFGRAAAEFEESRCGANAGRASTLTRQKFLEAQFTARVFAAFLEDATEQSRASLPTSFFTKLARYENENQRNPRHLEGGIMALQAATSFLDDALIAAKNDGYELDFQAAIAARGIIEEAAELFANDAASFDGDVWLDWIRRAEIAWPCCA